jgi:succinate dehydrogenase hydrophobic anchor subunit
MPNVQQSTSSRLKMFVSEFKETFTSDGHVLFYVLCGNFFFFFFLMHINAYYNAYFNDFSSIFVYFLEL